MKLVQVVLCAALTVAAAASVAQTKRGDVVVNVPFDFQVSGQRLPAGHYIVTPEGDACIRIFNFHRQGLYVPTHAAIRNAGDGTKLVFHRFGDKYFLSGVWVTGDTIGRELYRSRAEKEMANRSVEMEVAVVRPMK